MKTASNPVLKQKYRNLRHLLAANTDLLESMADIESDLLHLSPGECRFRESVVALLDKTLLLIEDLNLLADGHYRELFRVHGHIEAEIREYLRAGSRPEQQRLSFQLKDVDRQMAALVGGKAANLGDIMHILPSVVPGGFVITTAAYRLFLQENDLSDRIRSLMTDLSLIANRDLCRRRTDAIRILIHNSPVPAQISAAIEDGWRLYSRPEGSTWAVRSSSVGEDGKLSFAGQFDTFLETPHEHLRDAYKKVLASRYSDRAVQYRIAAGVTEVDTPMAVLFQPMINAASAGVLYTRTPHDAKADRMIINSVHGLADRMVQGQTPADQFEVTREEPGTVVYRKLADPQNAPLTPEQIKALAETALAVEKHFGKPQDIEWAIDRQGCIRLLQTRELQLAAKGEESGRISKPVSPLLSGGTTIFAGRAVGQAHIVHAGEKINSVSRGAVLFVEQATPELAVVLPKLGGVVAAHGNPAGHAATLIREFAVPCIFGVISAETAVREGQTISLDATRRAVYDGVLWPDIQERVQNRIRRTAPFKPEGLLHERILALNLVNPQAFSFRPKSCRSIHDIVRFVHEKAVGTMFEVGDKQAEKFGHAAKPLKTDVPLNLVVFDLGGGLSAGAVEKGTVLPEDIVALPFRALWNGINSPGVRWTGRTRVSASGFASVVGSSLAEAGNRERGLGAANYLMVGSDYLCLNARLAYHFSMIDTMIGDAAENNYVNFRFRGGGAGAGRRDLRARFLARVLLHLGFGVDRRGDLVTAWLRRYPLATCEEGLTQLGRLMGCARQLDMLLNSLQDVNHYVERFVQGDYEAFA